MAEASPVEVFDLIVAALAGTALNQAVSHMGVMHEGSPRLDRSFAVIPATAAGFVDGRIQNTVPGARIGDRYTIELGHMLKPKAGLTAYRVALQDLKIAIVAITNGLVSELSVSDIARTIEGGGQYLVTRFSLRVFYRMSLVQS